MRYLSVCSGIEAATVAWHPLGWKPVAFSEIEPFPSAVLTHHYPEVPNLGDMTKYATWPIQRGDIDLLVGGTPCQSFSVAGLRKGLSDPRGGLMLTYLEIARRLRPRWIVWENVPGVLSSGRGRDFGAFLGALGELGYGWAYRVLDAQWVRTQRHPRAVPQRRRRVFVVGCLGDATAAAAVLFERESVCRDPAPRGAPRQGAAADAKAGARADGSWWDGSDCAATLTKQNANGAQRMPDKDNFGAVLQPIVIDRAAFNQGEHAQYDPIVRHDDAMPSMVARGPHAVAFPIDGRNAMRHPEKLDEINRQGMGTGESFDPSHTLTKACVHAVAHGFYSTGGTHGLNHIPEVSPAVKVGSGLGIPSPPAVAFTCKDYGADAGFVAPTLRAMPHHHTHANGGGQVAVAFTQNQREEIRELGDCSSALGGQGTHQTTYIAFRKSKRAQSATDDESWVEAEQANTLNAFDTGERDTHAVAFSPGNLKRGAGAGPNEEVFPTIKCSAGRGADDQRPCVAQSMTVRRLTPRECERLQAFPDDYTMIPWRGKSAADCPDGPRYKALGNSMAVNCMEWIGERIAAYEDKHR